MKNKYVIRNTWIHVYKLVLHKLPSIKTLPNVQQIEMSTWHSSVEIQHTKLSPEDMTEVV